MTRMNRSIHIAFFLPVLSICSCDQSTHTGSLPDGIVHNDQMVDAGVIMNDARHDISPGDFSGRDLKYSDDQFPSLDVIKSTSCLDRSRPTPCQPDEICNIDSGVCEKIKCQPDCLTHTCGLDPICGTKSCGSCNAPEVCSAAKGSCVCDLDCQLQTDKINAIEVIRLFGSQGVAWFIHSNYNNDIKPPVTLGIIPSGIADGCKIYTSCIPAGQSWPDGTYRIGLSYRYPNGTVTPSVGVDFSLVQGSPIISLVSNGSNPGEKLEIANVSITGSGGHPIVSWDLRYR